MKRVAIVAAMAGEVKPLARGWRHERANGVEIWRWSFQDGEGNKGEWIAACAGAGVAAAARAFAEIEKDGPIDLVISIGWAGALSEAFEMGKAYWAAGVIDAQTGERIEVEVPDDSGDWPPIYKILVTCARVADEGEKRRLAAAYGAGMVDMEAAGVARLALMRGIPFFGLKGISDGYKDKLPDFNRFIQKDGRFRLISFIVYVLPRPWYWPALVRMGENSRKASLDIAESLWNFLDERGFIRKQNGYPKHNC